MNSLDKMQELMSKREPLIPILRAHIRRGSLGDMIQHPLIQEIMYRPEMNALINYRYHHKVEELTQAIARKDWFRVVWIHERPWRIDALLKFQHDMADQDYWALVGGIWTDSENIWQCYDNWRTLWESPRPDKHHCMDDEEREALASLPDSITVFRGVGGKGITKARKRIGMSWTTDREKAEWFAERWKQSPTKVLEGTVQKSDVHAFFNGRGENEIVSTKVKL